MNSAGIATVGTEKYFLFLNDVKGKETFTIISPYHSDYIYHRNEEHRVLQNVADAREFFDDGYVVESVCRLKVSGKVKYYKDYRVIENILNVISFARNYTFQKSSIVVDSVTNSNGVILKEFKAVDDNISYHIITEKGLTSRISVHYGAVSIDLKPVPFSLPYATFDYSFLDSIEKKNIMIASLKTITLPLLQESLDMSWYIKDGKKIKNYSSVTTIAEFECNVITPVVRAMQDCAAQNKTFYISLDTETTGFNIYNLKKDNEYLDHCVAVILSWEEDQGVVIFTDMEHFNSIPNEYVWSRLAILFERFDGEREITLYGTVNSSEERKLESPDVKKMDFFSDGPANSVRTEVASDSISKVGVGDLQVIDTVKFSRSTIDLIGHNVMFDKRVGIGEGFYLWFDDDTLQMAFDLNPKTVRGFNKLKGLTRRIFKHETPELSDILGAGNEDKYRYLVDREVAEIYGCADGDYTRKVFMYLKGIMSPILYKFYKKQDVPMLNILPRSEYYGLRTIEEDVIALAEESYENLERLKQFIYEYVGSFVDYYQQRTQIEFKAKAGYYATDEEYQKAKSEITFRENKVYEFEFKPAEIRKVLYGILKYPIVAYTKEGSNIPKIDKYVMKKLKSIRRDKNDVHFKKMNKDLLIAGADPVEYARLRNSKSEKDNSRADKMVLISADTFNKCKYPMAYVLSEYATLNKEYTSYFKPIREQNMEGKIFKSYSLARIETRRISNPAQTMKGNLKALIRSYSDDYYMLDFDMSQVEYRIMLSLSQHIVMIERMKNPERDYHTETASLINHIPAHKVDKKTRKAAKSVSFGVPYGLGERTLCANLFGVVNSDTLLQTRIILAKWEENNHPIVTFLNENRDNALLQWAMNDELRTFMDAWDVDEDGNKTPIPLGRVQNELGFYRTFDLSNIDFSEEAKARRKSGKFVKEEAAIRRPAGNYPIQAFASELFRCILTRFYFRCEKEGINDKLIWHMLIHDELLCSVHKSLHPYYIYKLVKESCMVTMTGHTKYFVGINIGNTWAETKDDAREAPVYFVERMIKRWDAGEFGKGPFWFNDPWEELIKGDRAAYVDDRIGEVIREVQPDIDEAPINIPLILEQFSNYTVRAYVNDYKPNRTVDKSKFDLDDPGELNEYQDLVWISKFETWALPHFGEGKPVIGYDNRVYLLSSADSTQENDVEMDEIDLDDLFDYDLLEQDKAEEYWTFDEQEASDIYDSSTTELQEESEEDALFASLDNNKVGAKNIAQFMKQTREYKHLKVLNEQVVITLTTPVQIAQVKKYLEPSITKTGRAVYFKTSVHMERWLKIKTKTDLHELDDFIDGLTSTRSVEKYKSFNVVGCNVVIRYDTIQQVRDIKMALSSVVQGRGDYNLVFKSPTGSMEPWQKVTKEDLNKIETILQGLEVSKDGNRYETTCR